MFRSLKEDGYHVAYLAPRGDLYAEEATELGVNEYGYLANQTLPGFKGPSKFDLSQGEDMIWNRLFYIGNRAQNESVDYDENLTRGALKWLENPPQEPWVLFLPYIFPHAPFRVEEPFFSMYNRSEMPVPASADDRVSSTFPGEYTLPYADFSLYRLATHLCTWKPSERTTVQIERPKRCGKRLLPSTTV